MSTEDNPLLVQYRAINQRLKRKLLRKPNFEEASDALVRLLADIRKSHRANASPAYCHYAAFLSIAVARCEEAIHNHMKSALHFLAAGEVLFEEAARTQCELEAPHVFEDSVEGINCYSLAIKIYIENKKYSLASSLYLEMATILKELRQYGESLQYFKKAAELQQRESTPTVALASLEQAFNCAILLGSYVICTELLEWIAALALKGISQSLNQEDFHRRSTIGLISGYDFYQNAIASTRVRQVLLYLLQRDFTCARQILTLLSQDGSKTEIRPSPFDSSSTSAVSALLADFVSACEHRDVAAVNELKYELWTMLSPDQYSICSLLFEELA